MDPTSIEENVTQQFTGFAPSGFDKVALTLGTLGLLFGGLLVAICSR
jgi:hypothetical protein